MPRYSLAAASLFVTLPALAQSTATDPALLPRPSASLRASTDALLPGAVSADSPLTDDQLARRLSLFYSRQSELFAAAADHDEARYVRLLDDLVADMNLLAQRPGIRFEPRFRELFGTVLAESERFYDRPALDRGDVYAIRAAGIDAVERGYDLGQPLVEHVTLPDLGTFATTIPMDVNPQVDRYVQFLLNRPSHTSRLRERADTYFPMVERILQEEGVPDELKYLAMVESALNPAAYSHMAAAGMWQFIRATGGAYGLRVERDIDDRLDPEQATRAAARHLRDLYDRFGDWQLALAGYNCNPAVISRAAARFQERTGRRATFWDIEGAIPRETRAYVPMFIATTLVVSNPDAYNLPAYTQGAAYTFDRVSVEGGTRLSEVARAIDTDEAVLRALNPSLRAGLVPDSRSTHQLRIPIGHASEHADALRRFAPRGAGLQMAAETVRFGSRAVRPVAPQERGEALVAMASRQALRPRRGAEAPVVREAPIRTYSPTVPPQTLAFDARAVEDAARVAARRADEIAAADRAQAAAEAAAAQAMEARETVLVAAATPVVDEVVVADETIEPVAEEVLVAGAVEETVADDVEVADEAEPVLVAVAVADEVELDEAAPATAVGLVSADLLSLAQAAPPPPPAPVREAPRAEPAREDPTPVRTVSARATTHRVGRGETLTGIARQYDVSVSQLREWNGIGEGSTLYAGRTLRLTADGRASSRSSRATTPRAATPAAPTRHTVRSGENLSRIARQYGTTAGELQRLNNLRDSNIRAGQTLRLPAPARRGTRG